VVAVENGPAGAERISREVGHAQLFKSECTFGMWNCPGVSCGRAHYEQYFDFTHKYGNCWDEIPAGPDVMAVEIDFMCYMQEGLGCESMEARGFDGLSMMAGCEEVDAGSNDLLTETCSWRCKMGRPVARCEWAFDPVGRYQSSSGALEACWVKPTCWGTSRVEVSAVCKPHEFWMTANHSAAELARMQAEAALEAEAGHGGATAASGEANVANVRLVQLQTFKIILVIAMGVVVVLFAVTICILVRRGIAPSSGGAEDGRVVVGRPYGDDGARDPGAAADPGLPPEKPLAGKEGKIPEDTVAATV